MGLRYVDKCPDCGQGLVLIMKDLLTNKLILICDDCETIWRDPELFYNGDGRLPFDEKVELTENVSVDEITAEGWEKFVKNMDAPINI